MFLNVPIIPKAVLLLNFRLLFISPKLNSFLEFKYKFNTLSVRSNDSDYISIFYSYFP